MYDYIVAFIFGTLWEAVEIQLSLLDYLPKKSTKKLIIFLISKPTDNFGQIKFYRVFGQHYQQNFNALSRLDHFNTPFQAPSCKSNNMKPSCVIDGDLTPYAAPMNINQVKQLLNNEISTTNYKVVIRAHGGYANFTPGISSYDCDSYHAYVEQEIIEAAELSEILNFILPIKCHENIFDTFISQFVSNYKLFFTPLLTCVPVVDLSVCWGAYNPNGGKSIAETVTENLAAKNRFFLVKGKTERTALAMKNFVFTGKITPTGAASYREPNPEFPHETYPAVILENYCAQRKVPKTEYWFCVCSCCKSNIIHIWKEEYIQNILAFIQAMTKNCMCFDDFISFLKLELSKNISNFNQIPYILQKYNLPSQLRKKLAYYPLCSSCATTLEI
jgi:hypothetical protein